MKLQDQSGFRPFQSYDKWILLCPPYYPVKVSCELIGVLFCADDFRQSIAFPMFRIIARRRGVFTVAGNLLILAYLVFYPLIHILKYNINLIKTTNAYRNRNI